MGLISMLQSCCIFLVLFYVAAAVYADIMWGKIPNTIPASMVLVSAPFAFLGDYITSWILNIASALIIFYTFWIVRVWGAGDSKLLVGVAALVPEYPRTALFPRPEYGEFFFLSVVFNMFTIYIIYVLFLILTKSSRKRRFLFKLASASLLFIFGGFFFSFVFVLPFLMSFVVYIIYSEASLLRLTRYISIPELSVGDNIAEEISLDDGLIKRKPEEKPTIFSLLGRVFSKNSNSIIAPSSAGISTEEKKLLFDLFKAGKITYVRVYDGIIMTPIIFVALVLAIFFGDFVSFCI